MKLQALVSVLFGLASAQTAQTYYLGDDHLVNFKHVVGHLPVGSVIKHFYMNFSSSTARLTFTNTNYTVKLNNAVTLTLNFGSSATSLKAPATLSGNADIVAVRQDGKEQRIAQSIPTARHLNTVATSGEVLKVGMTAGQYLVEFNGPQAVNMSKPGSWVVQLVEVTGSNLIQYDSFTVKSVSESKISSTLSRFTLTGDWMNSKVKGRSGLSFMVGVNSGAAFNNYAVTGNGFAEMNSWVVVDSNFNVVVPASVPEYNVTNITMNGGGVTNYWWLMATDQKTLNRYVLSCESMKSSDYGYFGWRVMPLDDNKRALSPGMFSVRAIYTSHMGRQSPFMDANNPSISISQMMNVVAHSPNADTAIAFSTVKHGKNLGGLSPKQNVTLNVYSVFKTVYLQWFKQAINHTNSTYGNITSGWKSDGPMFTRTFTPGTTTPVSLLVPEDVLTGLPDGAKKARLYGWAEDCYGEHFASQFIAGNLTFPAPSNGGGGSSGKLGAGAIVGIVCAVVFVCGVAAWWLCMRNNGGTDRYQKLDGH